MIKFRKAKKSDLVAIIEMIADDPLGSKRENFSNPLPEFYSNAFDKIEKKKDAELTVVIKEDKIRPSAINFYKSFGFVNSHEGFKLHL